MKRCEHINRCANMNFRFQTALVNRVTPEFEHPFLMNRRQSELARIEELSSQLETVDIATMELLDDEVVGLEQLRNVGNRLYGKVKQLDDSLGPSLDWQRTRTFYTSRYEA
jgi:anion-transporting  ArsA/GET3 family ATPase